MTGSAPEAGDQFQVGDLVDDTSVADLRELPPFANLLVWTMNSPYRMVDTPMPLPGSS